MFTVFTALIFATDGAKAIAAKNVGASAQTRVVVSEHAGIRASFPGKHGRKEEAKAGFTECP